MKQLYYRQKTLQLILFVSLVRLFIAGSIGLGNDEVYYRIYANSLQWNYFDHPPMVGWLIRISTLNLLFDNDLFIRLGAILSGAAATWLIFLCGKKISDAYTGFLAVILYSSCLYTSVICGIFILPDSPQMICWSAALLLLLTIAGAPGINRKRIKAMWLFGIVAGLGMLCKIHTSFLWLGLGLFVLLYNRRWLRQPSLYLSALTTVLFFYPVIRWNIDNHFISFTYHGNRVNLSRGGPDPGNLLSFTAGQLLYMNPVLFVLFILTGIAAFKNQLAISVLHKRMLLLTALPLLGISFAVACFRQVLPHWSGPACLSLILLTAAWLRKGAHHPPKSLVPPVLKLAGGLTVFILFAGLILVRYYPGTLSTAGADKMGEGDFTLDMYGWKSLRDDFAKLAEADVSSGRMKPNSCIISNKWFPAAHLEHYVAEPLHIPLLAIGELFDIHQYAWLNQERRPLRAGDDAWCIVPSNNLFNPVVAYASLFRQIKLQHRIDQWRNGKRCRYFSIYLLKDYQPASLARNQVTYINRF